MKATQAGTLKLPGGALGKVIAETTKKFSPELTLLLEDASGQSAVLYLVKAEGAGASDELPPVPPSGILDVRFSSNTNVENVELGAHTLKLSSATYPVSLLFNGVHGGGKLHLRLKDALGGTLVNEPMEEGRAVVVLHKLSELILEASNAPVESPSRRTIRTRSIRRRRSRSHCRKLRR